MAKLGELKRMFDDLGEPKAIVIDDPWVESQLPIGWSLEQSGCWYTAFLGEMYHTRPYTSMRSAIEQAWTVHNGTGQPHRAVAEKFSQSRAIKEVVRQMTLDDLL
jgi:hypothetical protein